MEREKVPTAHDLLADQVTKKCDLFRRIAEQKTSKRARAKNLQVLSREIPIWLEAIETIVPTVSKPDQRLLADRLALAEGSIIRGSATKLPVDVLPLIMFGFKKLFSKLWH